jgi:hypothetical protein
MFNESLSDLRTLKELEIGSEQIDIGTVEKQIDLMELLQDSHTGRILDLYSKSQRCEEIPITEQLILLEKLVKSGTSLAFDLYKIDIHFLLKTIITISNSYKLHQHVCFNIFFQFTIHKCFESKMILHCKLLLDVFEKYLEDASNYEEVVYSSIYNLLLLNPSSKIDPTSCMKRMLKSKIPFKVLGILARRDVDLQFTLQHIEKIAELLKREEYEPLNTLAFILKSNHNVDHWKNLNGFEILTTIFDRLEKYHENNEIAFGNLSLCLSECATTGTNI